MLGIMVTDINMIAVSPLDDHREVTGETRSHDHDGGSMLGHGG